MRIDQIDAFAAGSGFHVSRPGMSGAMRAIGIFSFETAAARITADLGAAEKTDTDTSGTPATTRPAAWA